MSGSKEAKRTQLNNQIATYRAKIRLLDNVILKLGWVKQNILISNHNSVQGIEKVINNYRGTNGDTFNSKLQERNNSVTNTLIKNINHDIQELESEKNSLNNKILQK